MQRQRLAATTGAVACLLTVAAVVVPYLTVADAVVVTEYYATGAVSPLAVGLLALVGVVAFAAGAYERSDPGVIAGLTLVAGAASLLVALEWALSFGGLRTDLGTEATYRFLSSYRWAVLLSTVVWTAAGVWYADALGLLRGDGG